MLGGVTPAIKRLLGNRWLSAAAWPRISAAAIEGNAARGRIAASAQLAAQAGSLAEVAHNSSRTAIWLHRGIHLVKVNAHKAVAASVPSDAAIGDHLSDRPFRHREVFRRFFYGCPLAAPAARGCGGFHELQRNAANVQF